jgi:very-short-patch-repair endonuclease
VILFSICYGPDAFGKVSMNFGPMNREGGERRLNVAITRARREVRVFSTLRADQIDLARTRARGVRDLKEFLAYAERGPSALTETVEPSPEADFDSPFEEAVYDALVQRGWRVHKQVGCARYRIDLAVVDPKAPGRYLLGVECDGANYHSAKAARDRDKLREGVLRDLGWELHRVWSTDWWTDPVREVEKLASALTRAAQRTGVSRPNDSPPELIEFADPVPPEEPSSTPPEPQPIGATRGPSLEIYSPVVISTSNGGQDAFYDRAAASQIRDQIIQVVVGEAPISLELAAKRVASAWGFDRVRARAVDRIRKLVPSDHVKVQRSGSREFLWHVDMSPEAYAGFRVPDADGNGARQATDLPLEEVANAAKHILSSHFSAPLSELARETARLFGIQRLGRVVDERMRNGIDLLKERGAIRLEGETVILETQDTQ